MKTKYALFAMRHASRPRLPSGKRSQSITTVARAFRSFTPTPGLPTMQTRSRIRYWRSRLNRILIVPCKGKVCSWCPNPRTLT